LRNYPAVKGTGQLRESLKNDDGRPGNLLEGPQPYPVRVVAEMGQVNLNAFSSTGESERRFLRFAFANAEKRAQRCNR
jgi:hypothetical protein